MIIKSQILKKIYVICLFFLFCLPSYSSDLQKDLITLENYLNSFENMSFVFEQSDNNQKEIGWMLLQKPDKLRIEYEGDNDLIIIANTSYLILYKAKDDIITSLSNTGPWNLLTKKNIKITTNLNDKYANVYLEATRHFSMKENNYIIYYIYMKDESGQFNIPILLNTSLNPFKIEGWEISNNSDQISVKVIEVLKLNEEIISSDMFFLSEKNREEGNVWLSPFKKDNIIRRPEYRN
ncbi:MAG: hypothetical protein CMJ12_01140 [Pelagibacterales bacterium]|nr:hypothetical protein [Pelagibacterales bacterium]PPR16620.1 MAG: hypothetical protein CFH33_00524 [Alphaproteobacteria bacterium MarineAlpha9_Bin3]|tara:strand:- start:48081 stop:48791 length:711 start_codon:yes stop_codon:yes gene_type:complete